MSLRPAFKVVLEKSISDYKCNEAVKQIRKTKGVISASFNKKSRTVTVNYETGKDVRQKVRQIEGVKELKPVV